LLSKRAFALGVVTINIAGSAGGLVMPHAMGWARERGGDFTLPTLLVTAVLIMAAVLVLAIAMLRQTTAER
jgi:uncharacterized membrane-anchored protein